jgi:hypothetical protein
VVGRYSRHGLAGCSLDFSYNAAKLCSESVVKYIKLYDRGQDEVTLRHLAADPPVLSPFIINCLGSRGTLFDRDQFFGTGEKVWQMGKYALLAELNFLTSYCRSLAPCPMFGSSSWDVPGNNQTEVELPRSLASGNMELRVLDAAQHVAVRTYEKGCRTKKSSATWGNNGDMLYTGLLRIYVQIFVCHQKKFLPGTAGAANAVVTTRIQVPGSSLKTYKRPRLLSSSIV